MHSYVLGKQCSTAPLEMAVVKWQNLAISAKPDIIRRVECGEKKSDVAASYSIPRSTLSMIVKNKANVRSNAVKRPGATGARRVHTAAYEDMKAAVYKWFMDVRSQNIPISGPITEQKVKDFTFIMNRLEFKGSSGWLQRFKECHTIVGQVITGENHAAEVCTSELKRIGVTSRQDTIPVTYSMPTRQRCSGKCCRTKYWRAAMTSPTAGKLTKPEYQCCLPPLLMDPPSFGHRDWKEQVAAVPQECTFCSGGLPVQRES